MGIRQLYDGLLSALTGAGRPFHQGDVCYLPALLSDPEIEFAFRASWLMRKIITKPATEMTREGRDWQADKDAIEKLEAEEKRLGLKAKLQQAEVLRGKGGGGMVLYIKGDRDQMAPIDPARIAAGGLTRVHVWHKSRFNLGPMIEDWTDPYFGHPSYYEVNLRGSSGSGMTKFHPSRVVAFRGKPVDDLTMGADRWWWGDSVVEVVKEAVDNVHTGQRAFAKLIRRTAIRRLSVPKLLEKVATSGAEDQFKKRVAALAAGENSDDITWLDAGDGEGKGAETISDHEVSWTNVPDVLMSYLAVAAAAANMPATVLLGKSPDGQNATGASDQRLWEQEVKSRQDLEHRPCLDQLDVALIPSAIGKVDDTIWWEFAPLSVPTEAEEATTFKTSVDAIDKLDQSGLVPKIALEKSVQNLLEERGWLPGIGDALAEIPEDERFPSLSAPDPDELLEDPSALQTTNGGKEAIQTSAGGGANPPRQRPARRAIRAANDAFFADGMPKPLYVRRDLLNAADLVAWAKANGFTSTLPAADMHVTVLYSRASVDLMKMGRDWREDEKGRLIGRPGGPREIVKFDGGAVVLRFACPDLDWRHKDMVEAGGSHDFDEYQPHVTLTYHAPEGVDLDALAPFRGQLVFGPEIFEALDLDWKSKVVEE